MSRFADRALCAVLATATFATSACLYGPTGTYLKETPLVLGPAEPIPVAKRVEVVLDGMNLKVLARPLCVAANVGEYTIVKEDRRYKHTKTKSHLIMAGIGAVAAPLGAVVIESPTVSEARFALGFPLLLIGTPLLVMGSIAALFPNVRRTTHEPSTHRAVTFASSGEWKECGELEASYATVTVEARGGSDTITIGPEQTGFLQLSDDIRAWASACNVDISLDVTISALVGDTFTTKSAILDDRVERANIINYMGREHGPSKIRDRLSLEDTHIELGNEAGRLDPRDYFETERWSFKISKPSSSVAPPSSGGTRAAELARACRDRRTQQEVQQRADARERCVAPLRAKTEAECRPTCTDTSKQKFCSVQYDECIKLTAGIQGTLRERCDNERATCLAERGQDSSSIERCTQTCATKVYDAKCPSL